RAGPPDRTASPARAASIRRSRRDLPGPVGGALPHERLPDGLGDDVAVLVPTDVLEGHDPLPRPRLRLPLFCAHGLRVERVPELGPCRPTEPHPRPGRRPSGGHAVTPPARSAGRFRTSVFRTALATMSPCWFRPMCSRVTIPSPGLDFDSRLSVHTVSA